MTKTLSVVVMFASAFLCAEEPQQPSAEQIVIWVRQLGSEEYIERQAAFERLKTAGEAAVVSIEKEALASKDPEICALARKLLHHARVAREASLWRLAIESEWIPALKNGKVSGPLFGAHTLSHDALEKLKDRDPSMGRPKRPFPEGAARDPSLEWICRTQELGGQWDSFKYGSEFSADVEQTSMALFAFLGAGHDEKMGLYKENVQKAVAWLRSRQRADGAILNEVWTDVDGITHAMAGLALAAAAGQGRRPDTIAAAQKAVDFSINEHQARKAGEKNGFGRLPKSEAPDLFTSTFFALQLMSARMAGLNVDPKALDGLSRFLDSVDAKDEEEGGFFSYVPGGRATPEATLMGCLVRYYLGKKSEDLAKQATAALKAFGDPTTGKETSDLVANYMAMMLAFQQGEETGRMLDRSLKAGLIDAQVLGGDADGSWNPGGRWAGAGRIFATSMNVFTLEVYFRYLPLYK